VANRLRVAAVVASAGLAACEPVAPPGFDRLPPVPDQDGTTCGAEGMQDLLGKDKSVFAAMTFPVGTRIIEPGMAITEDYRPDRLNFSIRNDGRIGQVWCG
jgi:hypothetical protein